jgi:hypothetical protein
MNRSLLMAAMVFSIGLAACDKPTVVNVPPTGAPGPAGPPGATGEPGSQGGTGNKGEAGKAGEGTTVIVMPPAASAPAN